MKKLNENPKSFYYFESATMQGLYDCLVDWQNTSQKRVLPFNIQQDGGRFCCIVLVVSPLMPYLEPTPFKEAMEKFQRKALKNIGKRVEFVSYDIEPETIREIQIKLEKCNTPIEVKAVFHELISTESVEK